MGSAMCSLCYAVGVLCYAVLVVLGATCTTYLYSITLAMLYAYTEVEDTLVSIMA